MLKYMYIDESGDLGIDGSEYLILSALLVENPAVLDRIIKNMRRNKFKKELKKAVEIKANKSSKELKICMLQKLNELIGAQIFYVVLEKKKLHSEFLKNNKHKLYNYVSGKLAKQMLLDNLDLEIRIDKSKGKQLLQEDFNSYFSKILKEKSSIKKIIIYHSYSHSWSGLQFADLLSWSCFQKFEHNNNEYVDIIKLDQEVYHVW
ncbi:DUF3800 domain-containing protein [Candidatus Woesearchaeota archaeon]|nr:DUF3800 domain-containing protein [Candidatus Woesearchaeota archaeon]